MPPGDDTTAKFCLSGDTDNNYSCGAFAALAFLELIENCKGIDKKQNNRRRGSNDLFRFGTYAKDQ